MKPPPFKQCAAFGVFEMNPHKLAATQVALLCLYIFAALVLDYAIFGQPHY
jgi:hypothetical protein